MVLNVFFEIGLESTDDRIGSFRNIQRAFELKNSFPRRVVYLHIIQNELSDFVAVHRRLDMRNHVTIPTGRLNPDKIMFENQIGNRLMEKIDFLAIGNILK